MPGKHIQSSIDQSCRRCKENQAVLLVRSEPLCRDCFVKYVHTKVIKRMESFRVRNAAPDRQRKILLPVSSGVSSISLLNIMDHHLKTQQTKTGRTGFSLTVLHVDTSIVDKTSSDTNLLRHLQERYPNHSYASASITDVAHVAEGGSMLLHSLGIPIDQDKGLNEQLPELISSLESATARLDVVSTLRTRLIVERAKSIGCEGILWGDSTTRLAEKTLAETAKGRGFSLPWQVSDGESPLGIAFNYPMRDVLKKELVSYADMFEPPLSDLVRQSANTQASMSSKNTTIDDLMKQYFESVEENFPSIVSNVIRTTGKLEAPPTSGSETKCRLCGMPVLDGRFGIHGWGGDQQDGVDPSEHGRLDHLCYGCSRSVPSKMR